MLAVLKTNRKRKQKNPKVKIQIPKSFNRMGSFHIGAKSWTRLKALVSSSNCIWERPEDGGRHRLKQIKTTV